MPLDTLCHPVGPSCTWTNYYRHPRTHVCVVFFCVSFSLASSTLCLFVVCFSHIDTNARTLNSGPAPLCAVLSCRMQEVIISPKRLGLRNRSIGAWPETYSVWKVRGVLGCSRVEVGGDGLEHGWMAGGGELRMFGGLEGDGGEIDTVDGALHFGGIGTRDVRPMQLRACGTSTVTSMYEPRRLFEACRWRSVQHVLVEVCRTIAGNGLYNTRRGICTCVIKTVVEVGVVRMT